MKTQTIVNGIEFKNYDNFQELLKELEQYYINQYDYENWPQSSEGFFAKAIELFKASSDEEREFIFGFLVTLFDNALRHYKVDLDYLYTEKGSKKFDAFKERYKEIWRYMGKIDSFNIGI